MKTGEASQGRQCWICGAAADSSEHRIKSSDLRRRYGRGKYRGATAPAHIRAGELLGYIQGPNAESLRYPPSVCTACNSTRTQPFDRAYDLLVSWLASNESVVLGRRFLDFTEIYGPDFPQQQLNLFRYFAKSFGCRLVDAGQAVPVDIVTLLNKAPFQTALRLTCAVNEDVLLLPQTARNGLIGKGDLHYLGQADELEGQPSYIWVEYIDWLRVNYWYAAYPDGSTGSTWIADSQYMYLGSVSPLDDDTRSEIMERVRPLRGDS
jgi:hypothetical protein